MHRAVAFLGAFVLLVPLVGLLGSHAEQLPCCSGTFCPFTGQHTHNSSAPQQMDCDHPAPSPADCAMKSGCGAKGQYGVLGPLPPVVLHATAQLPSLGIERASLITSSEFAPVNFLTLPSPPPRG